MQMKKILSIVTATIIIMTNSTYALVPQNIDKPEASEKVLKSLAELDRINDDLNLTYTTILSGNYDDKKVAKEMNFLRTRIYSVLRDIQLDLNQSSTQSNPLKMREFETIQLLATGYLLATSGLLLYTQDKSGNQRFLFDSISAYNNNKGITEELKENLRKAYGINIK